MGFKLFQDTYSRLSSKASDAKEYLLAHREAINTALQWYNFSVAVLVMLDYMRNMATENPKDPVEYGSDIAIHLLQWSLNLSSGLPKKLLALSANGYRGIDIPLRMLLGTATVPGLIGVVDVGNHFLNGIATTAAIFETETTQSRKCSR